VRHARDDAFISDQVLPFLLQNTLRMALRCFVRAELSGGQYTLSPSGHQSLAYGYAQVRKSMGSGTERRQAMGARTVKMCQLS
jgi:hypothetical protein